MGFTTNTFRWQLLKELPNAPGPDPRALDRFRGNTLAANVLLVARRKPPVVRELPVAMLTLYGRKPDNDGSIWMGIPYFTGTSAEVRDATIEITERLMEEGLYHGDLEGGANIVPMTRTLRAVMEVDAAGDPGVLSGPLDPDYTKIRKAISRTLLNGEVDDTRIQQKATIRLTERTVLLGGRVRVKFQWRLNVLGSGWRPRA